jgi:hypothetical protein
LWTVNPDKLRTRPEEKNLHPIMHTLAGHYGIADKVECEERKYWERDFYTTRDSTIRYGSMYDRSPYRAAITMPYVDGVECRCWAKVCHGVRCRGCKSLCEKLFSSDDESHHDRNKRRI